MTADWPQTKSKQWVLPAPHAWVHGSPPCGYVHPSSRESSTGQILTNLVTVPFGCQRRHGFGCRSAGRLRIVGARVGCQKPQPGQVWTDSPVSGLYKKRRRTTRNCVIDPTSCVCIPHPQRLPILHCNYTAQPYYQFSLADTSPHPIQHTRLYLYYHRKRRHRKSPLHQHHVSKIGLLSRLLLAQRCLLRTSERMPAHQANPDNGDQGKESQELRLLLLVQPWASKHLLIHRHQELLLTTHLVTKVEHLLLNLSRHNHRFATETLASTLLSLDTTRLSYKVEENGTGGYNCLMTEQ